MPTFRLQIKCDNAAFADDGIETEVARILRRVAADVAEQGDRSGVCMDANGNRVGSYTLTGGK